MGPWTRFPYESRALFLMTSLQYYSVLHPGARWIQNFASQRQNYAQKMQEAQVTKSLIFTYLLIPGHIAQSVTTDACLAADQRVSEFDPSPVPYFRKDWSWNKLIPTIILHPRADSFKNGCCQ